MRLLLAVTITMCLAGCSFLGSPAPTKVAVYTTAGFKATHLAQSSCFTSSIASTRHDAYRCSVGNSLFDPCFVSGSAAVACPTDLLRANQGTLINLTSPLPSTTNTAAPAKGAFWLFKLANGKACGAITGTMVDANYPDGCVGQLYCTVPAPENAVYYTECGTVDTSGFMAKIVHPQKYAIAVLWR